MSESDVINAVLVALTAERVKAEVCSMLADGATAEQVNDILPDVIAHYSHWQRGMLARIGNSAAKVKAMSALPPIADMGCT